MDSRQSLAVVLLSGGLDSATVLAMARERGFGVHSLAIAYGQRHNAELAASRRLSATLGALRHHEIAVGLGGLGGSALTDSGIQVPESPSPGIPVTYVPARNTVMLSLALALAEVVGAQDLFIGVNAVDYSGYPDCRPAFVEAFERLANLATRDGVEGRAMRVHAPLIDWSKARIIEEGTRLGVDYAATVSCYQADDQGRACGRCDACRLRRQGFAEASRNDPTRYQP
jgi:preQ(0) biosynthesis protein QueC